MSDEQITKAVVKRMEGLEQFNALVDVYNLIHPNTTPDANKISDGDLLDMIFEIVKPFVEDQGT